VYHAIVPAVNKETEARVVRELKTDFGELELHDNELKKITY